MVRPHKATAGARGVGGDPAERGVDRRARRKAPVPREPRRPRPRNRREHAIREQHDPVRQPAGDQVAVAARERSDGLRVGEEGRARREAFAGVPRRRRNARDRDQRAVGENPLHDVVSRVGLQSRANVGEGRLSSRRRRFYAQTRIRPPRHCSRALASRSWTRWLQSFWGAERNVTGCSSKWMAQGQPPAGCP